MRRRTSSPPASNRRPRPATPATSKPVLGRPPDVLPLPWLDGEATPLFPLAPAALVEAPFEPPPLPPEPLLAASTVTDAFMNGCGVQWYEKVPGVVNVKEPLAPLASTPVLKLPLLAVAECREGPWLNQVTRSPTWMVSDCGPKAKSWMETEFAPAVTAAGRGAGEAGGSGCG